jgi:hypothetical protein
LHLLMSLSAVSPPHPLFKIILATVHVIKR